MGSCYASTVIKTGQSFLGYTEGPGKNENIFGKHLSALGYFNGDKSFVEWCGSYCYDVILRSCFGDTSDYDETDAKWDTLRMTHQPSRDNCAAGCKYGAAYFRAAGRWSKTAKIADVVFYGSVGSEYHQGLVETLPDNSGYFYALEGNHGNKVARVKRNLSEVAGFGHPDYDDEPDPEPTPDPTPKPTPTPTSKTYTVKTHSGSGLKLRAEPNTSSAQVGWIPDGVTVTGEVVSGEEIGGNPAWIRTESGGYCSGHWVVPEASLEVEPTPTLPEKKGYPGPWPTRPSRGYFQRGDAGTEVVKLQKLLEWTKPGCLPRYGCDGEIGSETLTAVKTCQALWGAKVDGFYGKNSEQSAKAYKK